MRAKPTDDEDIEKGKPASPNHIDNMEEVATEIDDLKTESYIRVVLTIFQVIALVAALIGGKSIENITVYHIISYLLFFFMILVDFYLLLTILSFKHLHYIRVKRKRVENAKYLWIPYGYEEVLTIPMSSISMLVGLRGSNLDALISMIFFSTSTCMVIATFAKWTERSNKFGEVDVELIFFMAGAAGMFLAHMWRLDQHNTLASAMHYVSVALLVCLLPLGFAMCQDWSFLSILLLMCCWFVLGLWLGLMEYVQRKKFDNDNLQLVHKYSLLVLIIELIAVNFLWWTGILFVWCLAHDNYNIL